MTIQSDGVQKLEGATMGDKVRAADIVVALAKRHEKTELFFTEVCPGPSYDGRRLDAVAITRRWRDQRVYGYEIKVSRQDFLQDRKWPDYLSACHHFAFVCPAGLIAKEELDDCVGLLYYYPEAQLLKAVRKPMYRNIETPIGMIWSILINRVEDSGEQIGRKLKTLENLRSYIGQESLSGIGTYLRTRLPRRVDELERALYETKRDNDYLQQDIDRLKAQVAKLQENVTPALTSDRAHRDLTLIAGWGDKIADRARQLIAQIDGSEQAVSS